MNQTNISWWRVGSITAVQGAITLCWVLYNLYLPLLLIDIGFGKEEAVAMAGILLIIENALEAIIEPVAGGMSDRTQKFIGTRLPFIFAGVVLSSVLFILLPVLVVFGQQSEVSRWLLLILAVLWASAMAIFRSPTMVLLGKSSPPVKLPVVASFLTLIQQLVGGIRFFAYGFIISLGASFTFFLGSVVLLGGAAFLRWAIPPDAPLQDDVTTLGQTTPFPWKIAPLLVGMALGLGWGLRFMFATVNKTFGALFNDQKPLGMLAFSIAIAVMALLAGYLASKIGNRKVMLLGIIALAILINIFAYSLSISLIILVAFLLAFAFSCTINGSIPLILNLVPSQKAGLGIGLYFGGFGAAMSLFDILILPRENITIPLNALFSAIAFIIAGVFIFGTRLVEKKEL